MAENVCAGLRLLTYIIYIRKGNIVFARAARLIRLTVDVDLADEELYLGANLVVGLV